METYRDQLNFPIDALLISGYAHAGAGSSMGLFSYLRNSPAVRSHGIVTRESDAESYISSGAVNTVFVNPCNPSDGPSWWDVEPFITRVRDEWPSVVFVLYCDQHCRERFCSVHPRFLHFFHLEEVFAFAPRNRDQEAGLVASMMNRCQDWHKARYEYDICLSFAGEDRPVSQEVALLLRSRGCHVFYDEYEDADLLGKNLYDHLHEVYSRKSRYCAIFVSKAYASKLWTSHERTAAQERAFNAKKGAEYILPVRIDNTPLKALPRTIGYVSIDRGVEYVADVIHRKLWLDDAAPKHFIGDSLY